jgi:hypothetical protein
VSKSIGWISVVLSCCLAVTALAATNRTALPQAGSTGGTIGKTDKSASGGDESASTTGKRLPGARQARLAPKRRELGRGNYGRQRRYDDRISKARGGKYETVLPE